MSNTEKMTVETLKAKVRELCKNEDFLKNLFECEEPEDAQEYLKKAGIDFSLDEVKIMAVLLNLRAQDKISDEDLAKLERGEIPEGMLADVNGGASEVVETIKDWGISIVAGGLFGAAAGAATGALAGGIGALPGAFVGAVSGMASGFFKGMIGSIVRLKW
ncbi:MAG: hypothetical protein MJ184_08380 [Treponema sp.]|uniref:DUF6861 domain-containing protein n=1 Tax=Treponema sp. TaxID=166 RepID=UPI00298D9E2E|nr:hypothetical protein [Treponema sp.]MCQ2601361.1 hypothetical protein [Treponema sp.]